jgi:hypothetical protein
MGLEQERFVVTLQFLVSCWPLFESASADDVVVLVLHDVQSRMFPAHQLPEFFIREILFGAAVNKSQREVSAVELILKELVVSLYI